MPAVLPAVAAVAGIVAGAAKIGSTVMLVATAVSVAASVGAQLLQKKPPAQGATTEVTIGANEPIPYAIGRTYPIGRQAYDVGYGGTVGGVPNPYSSTVRIWSLGPIQGEEGFQVDFAPVTFSGGNAVGYYHDFMYRAAQIGLCPEASPLAGPFGSIPGWGSSAKLSGLCADLLTLKFDRKGKVYASGVPQSAPIINGVHVYDPRQDDTAPGGEGDCRALDEDSYVGGAPAKNPGCHGVTYALGRFQNGKRRFGVGYPADSIDWPTWIEFMNVCDANSWEVGGTIFEGGDFDPSVKWNNLKRICAAGGAKPAFSGGKLTVIFPRPRVPIFTLGIRNLAAEAGEPVIPAMRTWKGRLNGLRPKFRSEANRWEYVQSAAVIGATWVEEDGEEKIQERQYDLIQDKDQVAQVAAYDVAETREIEDIQFGCNLSMAGYRIGDCGEIGADLAEATGLAAGQLVVITGRRKDPASGAVLLTFATETNAKHEWALGRTGTAPPSASLPTAQERDEAAAVILDRAVSGLISTSSVQDADPLDGLLQADDESITIEGHSRRYDDRSVSVDGATLTGLAAETLYHVYYDDPGREGGAVTYAASTSSTDAVVSEANPYRHYVGSIVTDAVGGTGTSAGGQVPPGWNPNNYFHNEV